MSHNVASLKPFSFCPSFSLALAKRKSGITSTTSMPSVCKTGGIELTAMLESKSLGEKPLKNVALAYRPKPSPLPHNIT